MSTTTAKIVWTEHPDRNKEQAYTSMGGRLFRILFDAKLNLLGMSPCDKGIGSQELVYQEEARDITPRTVSKFLVNAHSFFQNVGVLEAA